MTTLFIAAAAGIYFIAAAWEWTKADGFEPPKSSPGGHALSGIMWLAMGAWGLYVLVRVA